MVVVAISSLLAAVATPSYQGFADRARKSEAKTNLGGLYAAETVYQSEFQTFTSRFDAVGFGVTGFLWFNIGFDNDLAPSPYGPAGSASCRYLCSPGNCGAFTRWTCRDSANNGLDGAGNAQVSVNRFRAGAHSHFSQASEYWFSFTIDQDKRLQELIPAW